MDEQLRELKNRGSLLFPFETYHTLDPLGNFFVSCHWHPDTEIIHLQKGTINLFIDGESYLVSGENIFFVNRGELHYLYSAEPGTLYDASVFPLEMLSFEPMDFCQQRFILPMIRNELRFPRFLSAGDPCFEPVREQLIIIAGLQRIMPPGYQISIKAALYQILSSLLSVHHMVTRSGFRQLDSQKLDTMKQISTYIEEHLTEKLSLELMAAHFYMTPNYFCKYFKQNFGTGFTKYLNNLRLEKACVLLAKTDLPIMEVCLRSGFENLSYFIRLFKSQQGVPPTGYRKQCKHQRLAGL